MSFLCVMRGNGNNTCGSLLGATLQPIVSSVSVAAKWTWPWFLLLEFLRKVHEILYCFPRLSDHKDFSKAAEVSLHGL